MTMKKKIVVLGTGGTIAGEQHEQGRYHAGRINAQALLDALPTIPPGLTITCEQIANVGSQSVTADIWLLLVKKINEISATTDVDGIVITHGTDTMEETAYFLNLLTLGRLPVVLTGAMKPADAFSADGPENLLSALRVASDAVAADLGVLVVMNNIIHAARFIQKLAVSQAEAFSSYPGGPLGYVQTDHVVWYYRSLSDCHTRDSVLNKALPDITAHPLPLVDILYVHGAMNTQALEHWASLRRNGIVLAGVGNGNMNSVLQEILEKAASQGVLVVRSSRLPYANTRRNVELNDNKFGFVAANDLNPQKARILLMLGLLLFKSPDRMQELFDTH